MSALRGIYEVAIQVRDTRLRTPQPGLFDEWRLDSTVPENALTRPYSPGSTS
jgi:hypothetical protein